MGIGCGRRGVARKAAALGLNRKPWVKTSLAPGSQVVTAYLEAVGTGQDPYELFDEENTVFALDWAELSTFLSTLDTLIPDQDSYHALLLLDTVTADLRLDASGATNREIIPRVFEIADKLDEMRTAIEAGAWDRAAELNDQYKYLATEYGPEFR